MLLIEQVRRIKNEENLVEDTNTYTQSSETDWVTKKTHSITLSAEKLIVVRWITGWYCSTSGTKSYGASRCLINNTPLISTGYKYGTNSGSWNEEQIESFIKLGSGTYTFDFQISASLIESGSYGIRIRDIYIGVIDFADTDIESGDSGDVNIDAGTEASVISKSFTAPSSRELAVGPIKKLNMIVIVNGLLDGSASSKMKDPDEPNDTDIINWKIYVNGIQQEWTFRRNDYQTDNPSYAEGAYGRLEYQLDPAASYTVEVKAYNGFAISKTVRAYLSIIYSPWVLTDSMLEPVTLDFPQGSTLYVTLEPLSRNPTKNVKIGKKRAVSFGDSTDYYSTASGTDILAHNYTFETVEIGNCQLFISGYGGCVSMIGVDVR